MLYSRKAHRFVFASSPLPCFVPRNHGHLSPMGWNEVSGSASQLPSFLLLPEAFAPSAPGAILIFKDMLECINTNAKSKQGKFLIMAGYIDPDLTPPDCSGVVPTVPELGKSGVGVT